MPGAHAPINIFSNLKHEIAAFEWNVNKQNSIQDGVFSPGILFSKRTLFALSHHYILWLAAEMCYPERKRPFRRYAILGDDVVIADEQVALQYRLLLDRMGVSISLSKSLISDNGTLEFAKRFWTKNAQVDISPISMQALLMCRSTIGLCQLKTKSNLTSCNVMFRLGGAGYRVRSRMMSTQSKRWERLRVAIGKPSGSRQLPIEWWIGRGKPINPYLKGIIVDYLRYLSLIHI